MKRNEQRQNPRFRVDLTATLTFAEVTSPGEIYDLSQGGMRVMAAAEAGLARCKSCAIRFRYRDQQCSAEARVEWSTPTAVGMSFTGMDESFRGFVTELTRLRPVLHRTVLAFVTDVVVTLA